MLLLALQFWEGDKALVNRLARAIADNEPVKRTDVGIIFCPRFDALIDADVVAHVKQKFDHVEVHKCRRRGAVGHPYGCNEIVHDLISLFHGRCLRTPLYSQQVDGVYLMEGDLVPMVSDWLDQILAEWRGAREEGKLILGAWQPEHAEGGHINGNLIFHPELAKHVSGMEGCPPFAGWDVYHAPKLVPVAKRSKLMKNLYRAKAVKKKDLKGWVMVHGVKDDSAWEVARLACGK